MLLSQLGKGEVPSKTGVVVVDNRSYGTLNLTLYRRENAIRGIFSLARVPQVDIVRLDGSVVIFSRINIKPLPRQRYSILGTRERT